MKRLALSLSLVAATSYAQLPQQPPAPPDEHPPIIVGVTPIPPAVRPPTPWMTVAQLLQLLDPPARAHDRQAAIDAGTRYVMGVFDTAVGKDFCYMDYHDLRRNPAQKPSPAALRATVVAGLRAPPPPGHTLNDRASAVLIRIFQGPWACPPEGCCD